MFWQTVDTANSLGEGILWDDAARCCWWTDIEGARLFRLDWGSAQPRCFPLPFRLGSFALTAIHGEFIGAFEHGFARFRAGSDDLEWIARPYLAPGVRFNDGRVDRQGRFVAGTMVEDIASAGDAFLGKLVRLEPDGHLTVLLEGIGISNSLCWSPDGREMYHSDTRSGQLNAYRYEAQAVIFDRVIRDFSGTGAGPDGACVDAAGQIWLALWGAGAVVRLDPQGTILSEHPLPASQPTCPAFGGPELDHLVVTTARIGLNAEQLGDEPKAGNVFMQGMEVQGLPEMRVGLMRL